MEQLIKHLQNIKVATQLMRVTGDISETGKSNLDYAIDEAIKLAKNNSVKADNLKNETSIANNVSAGISDDEIRHNLKDAEHWIEQARLSYFQHKDKAHFNKSIKFASKFINACR